MLRFLYPLVLCAFGTYLAFYRFWHGFDAISGDLGDARFNTLVLEHTWLWLKGHHELFNMPMFYPAINTYAYSDFLLGFAPVYWLFRAFGCEMLLSYQWWVVAGAVMNFYVFYVLLRKFFNVREFLAAIGAFIFAFSLPRVTHLEHAQLNAQFFIVVSAMGALTWWRDPTSRKAPWLFCAGAVMQFISAFYFFWFWIWTLGIYGIYISFNRQRRVLARNWFRAVPKTSFLWPFLVCGLLVSPFLYHYLLLAKEFGRRDWVSVSYTIPRVYSWINLPMNHWEWNLVPFKTWIAELPMLGEHYLSFGLVTWAGMIAALIWIYRKKTELKYLAIPLLTMFVFTITSGRFSTWVFMSYFFPGGGAIRAVGRIQIFMLMFWGVVSVSYLNELWNSGEPKRRALLGLMLLFLLGESFFVSDWSFSRAEDQARLARLEKSLPEDCGLIVNPAGFWAHSDFTNIDTVMIAFQTGRATANGYSGHEPAKYRDLVEIQKWNSLTELDGKKVCKLQ